MSKGYVLSVSQLNEYVASLINNDALLHDLTLRGEVSGFKHHSSGHLYFSMKDERSLVRCVMFKQNALSLKRDLRDGMQITAHGYASLFARDGQFQLYVRSVEEEGEGELYRRFLMMKARLEAQGFFEASHKKPIPGLPRCIGVVTSEVGAVIQDITNVVRRRYPAMDIILRPAKVQGENAARDIAAGIRELERDGRCDVIIVGRGGGSMEDLWAFNEEEVARAIYECGVPIISAVGHETDFSIADFTADLRAPTPSAAAELAVPEYEAECLAIDRLEERLISSVGAALSARRARLDSLVSHAGMKAPEHALRAARDSLLRAESGISQMVSTASARESARLASLMERLEALGPGNTLARGFAMIKIGNAIMPSLALAKPGDGASLIMQDGEADITIDSIKRSTDG